MRSVIKRLLGLDRPVGDVATGDWSPVPAQPSRGWSDWLEKRQLDDTPTQQLAKEALEGLAETHGKLASERAPIKRPAPQSTKAEGRPSPTPQKPDPLQHHIAPVWTSARPTTQTSAEHRAAPIRAQIAQTKAAPAAQEKAAPSPTRNGNGSARVPLDALSARRASVLGMQSKASSSARPAASSAVPRPARGGKSPVKALAVEARNHPERAARPRRPSRKTDVTQAARQSNPRLSALRQRPAPATPLPRARKPSGRHVLSIPATAAPLPQPAAAESKRNWVDTIKAFGEHLTDQELMILRNQLK